MTTTLSLLAALLLALHAASPWVIRRAYRIPRLPLRTTPADHGLAYEEVTLSTARGRHLHAWYLPGTAGGPAVAVMHGWGGNAEVMLPFAELLHGAGYGVLLVEARNHGLSDADDFSSLPRFAEDLEAGLGWLLARPEVDARRIALLGHSVGAAATLLVASRRPEVAAVVSIAAFAHPAELMRRHMAAHHIPHLPVGWWVLRVIERTIGARYDQIAPVRTITRIGCPVLLVHGTADRTVPAADAESIHAARPDDRVQLLLVPDADHDSVERIEEHGGELLAFLRAALATG